MAQPHAPHPAQREPCWEHPRLRDVFMERLSQTAAAGQEQLLENESRSSASSVHSGLVKPAVGPRRFWKIHQRGPQEGSEHPRLPLRPRAALPFLPRLRPAPGDLPGSLEPLPPHVQSRLLSSAHLPTPCDVRALRFHLVIPELPVSPAGPGAGGSHMGQGRPPLRAPPQLRTRHPGKTILGACTTSRSDLRWP